MIHHENLVELALALGKAAFAEATAPDDQLGAKTLVFPPAPPAILVPAALTDGLSKDAYAEAISILCQAVEAIGVVFITEAWTLDVAPGEQIPDTLPSESPQRKEVFLIQVESFTNPVVDVFMAPIIRTETERTLGEFINADSRGGRFGDGFLSDDRWGERGDA
jgi:hypothetical protein